MTRLTRSYWLSASALVYTCFSAAELGARFWPWIALFALPLALAEVWRHNGIPLDSRSPSGLARNTMRAAFFGGFLWLSARTGPVGHPELDALANLGTGVSCVSALIALSRIKDQGGLLRASPRTHSLDAAIFVGLLWGITAALPSTHALWSSERLRPDRVVEYLTTGAGVGTLLALVATSLRLRTLRRLELGVADRAAAALILSATAVLLSATAIALDLVAPHRVLPATANLAALFCTWASTTADPTAVSRAVPRVLTVALLGTPVAIATVYSAHSWPIHSGPVVLGGCCLAMVVGMLARGVAKPLAPERSRWLDALARANRKTWEPETEVALRGALTALHSALGSEHAKPQIWRRNPDEALWVDIAGYLHIEKAASPERLYDLALTEPESTLRVEVLRLVQVRRPEVRPLLSWFETHAIFSATLIVDDQGPAGFLALPGVRRAPLTLEEARAARALADRLSALLEISSALARSRARELEAEERAQRSELERERVERLVKTANQRQRASPGLWARQVCSTAFSYSTRRALEQLQRISKLGSPVLLISPSGLDPLPYAAHAHLSGLRASGPFIVVDATLPEAQKLASWQDEEQSPLLLCEGGSLMIVDFPALPAVIQDLVARAFAPHTSDAPLVTLAALIASSRKPLVELLVSHRITESAASHFAEAELALPALADRPEDLRAITLDFVSRLGCAERGEPLGLEPTALRWILEHDWADNELELRALLQRAARYAEGPAILIQDLFAANFPTAAVHQPATIGVLKG